ncbi:putative 7-carboxy-7-deazaguanine synthase QueE [Ruminococcus flavefaciens]|uniref:putative 7-carboxy-7-deazaguanine synthase QueE n=1 Tax=Ruminococcus flavefaciens TaxID=1265 RepID=UPI0002D2B9AD|nr:putative 7-carboxy-7-deazaguanine synthase QueE [Ruminococcus flavefaciens]
MSFPVVEKFVSINGEGQRAGEAAVFIRFRGCNLSCSYCDTKWANSPDAPAESMTAEEIVKYAASTGITDVTLTGGEPLLQPELHVLTDLLISSGHRVEIETNGSQPVEGLAKRALRPSFTLDYKLPDSGMESRMLTGNYSFLTMEDTVKFVAGSLSDLEKALLIIKTYGLCEKCRVYLSPVFGKIEPAQMVDFMIKNKMNSVRLQLQLHKFIWPPDMRGV